MINLPRHIPTDRRRFPGGTQLASRLGYRHSRNALRRPIDRQSSIASAMKNRNLVNSDN